MKPHAIILLFLITWYLGNCAVYATDYKEPIPITPELVSKALDPALMCLAAYTDAKVAGWQGPLTDLAGLDLDDQTSGFHACLYTCKRDGRTQLCLAFRGTQITPDFLDVRADILQALGEVPQQYKLARIRTQELKAYARKDCLPGDQIPLFSVTGHSLGGGLAEFGSLCWAVSAQCFATAPLGKGTQRLADETGLVGLRQAPKYITHFFIEGDCVPDSASFLGGHFGKIIDPKLAPPENLSGIDSGRKRLGVLMLAGLVLDDNKFLNRGMTVSKVIDLIGRHSVANYITALMLHAHHGNSLFIPGFWRSRGSFFQVSTTESGFALCANGVVELQNEFTVLGEKTFVADSGYWSFNGKTLSIDIPNLATLDYQLLTNEGNRAICWKRTDVRVNERGFLSAYKDRKDSAGIALLLLKGVCHMMKNKDVTWTRSESTLFAEVMK